uniref:LCN-type CS-alpha/beta domain-containing protein n=1 Tax=Strongyloides papillosus TaxID=174720 RepID=A0A0N5BFP9_STREA
MKIIYLFLTFAILYINVVEGVEYPRYIIKEGRCGKDSCVSACGGDLEANCLDEWSYWIFWYKSKCACFIP